VSRGPRVIAICLCRDGDRFLCFEAFEHGAPFYRPLGGGIHWGERSIDAVRREMREEIETDLTDVRLVGVLENLSAAGHVHEIVFVYDGRFVNEAWYDRETFVVTEEHETLKASWKRIDEFGPGLPPLYPDGLLELLKGTS
jgi:ADP-ribose pyrophosphatase YjhB (NUDIX family)